MFLQSLLNLSLDVIYPFITLPPLRCPVLSHLSGSPVLPTRGDMSDDAGMALLAHVDAVHLDNALARVETCDSRHSACRETDGRAKRKEGCQGQ